MSGDDHNPTSGAEVPETEPVPGEGPAAQAVEALVPVDDAAVSAGDQVTAEPGDVAEERAGFFIVGIGASAGGLEALSQLLKTVKLDCMAFVVVQHLAPRHESFLPALLARVSNISVELAADGTKIEANRVYVIPPNSDLAILRGVLHVITPPHSATVHGAHLPIDYFFRSLAQDL